MTDLTSRLAFQLTALNWMMATAESCTGGLIAASCTDLPGSSKWFERGFVTYSNAAKTDLLGVQPDVIAAEGAVSEAVARAMALGAFYRTPARVSVAVTGIAGPDGGSADKPVGTVWLAWCIDGLVHAKRQQFEGNRKTIREATVTYGLHGLLQRLPHAPY
ncbi:MAG: CinA family protein [Limnohabitans sp.]|jgi:nicotinamide-nucleotide amidase|uniref:CinA family protein n=1 Tax=Limnohabitans sp. TaxID=1907725 RepID=UPI0025D40CE4|nr:CinA family protein [Limnohabitans sp.]MCO4089722.1 CinA family protein [Limnohabitans sp.]